VRGTEGPARRARLESKFARDPLQVRVNVPGGEKAVRAAQEKFTVLS